jgi:hypothetical protein
MPFRIVVEHAVGVEANNMLGDRELKYYENVGTRRSDNLPMGVTPNEP